MSIKTPGIIITEPPKNAPFINFEVEREDWNLYKIEDGTLLRARFIVTGIMLGSTLEELVKRVEQGQKPGLGFGFRWRNLFATESPPELRGQPDSKKYTPKELQSSIVKEDIDFETVRETWNLYELENGIIIKARLSPVTVNKTNKFDHGGIPIYTINSNVDMKIEFPENIRKLLDEKHAKAQATRKTEKK